jgi:hypothetical protein
MMKTSTHIGLRDWAVTLEALGDGTQIILMRKGGIHEETRHFQVASDAFYLFPAFEHQKPELLKPEYRTNITKTLVNWSPEDKTISIKYYAQLYEDIEVLEEEKLQSLYPHHIWTNEFAAERLRWKKKLPLHLLLLRVYQLDQPVEIPLEPEYGGCKSWISLPDSLEGLDATPVLSNERFAQEVKSITQKLADLL